jgi:hypothetical protein
MEVFKKLVEENNEIRNELKRLRENENNEVLKKLKEDVEVLKNVKKQPETLLSVADYMYVAQVIEKERKDNQWIDQILKDAPLKDGKTGNIDNLFECDPHYLFQLGVGVLKQSNEQKSFENASLKSELTEIKQKLYLAERELERANHDNTKNTETLSRVRKERDDKEKRSRDLAATICDDYLLHFNEIRKKFNEELFTEIRNTLMQYYVNNGLFNRNTEASLCDYFFDVIRKEIFDKYRETHQKLTLKHI